MPAKVTRAGTADLWARDVPDAAARSVLTRAGATLVAAAKRKFQQSGKVASGSIMKSIVAQPATLKPTKYGGGQFKAWVVTVGPTNPAAKFIIAGRRKGAKMPPPEALLAWMKTRGIEPERRGRQSARDARMQLAWAIARSISRDGIKPFPFMALTFRETKTIIRQQIRDDLKKALARR